MLSGRYIHVDTSGLLTLIDIHPTAGTTHVSSHTHTHAPVFHHVLFGRVRRQPMGVSEFVADMVGLIECTGAQPLSINHPSSLPTRMYRKGDGWVRMYFTHR